MAEDNRYIAPSLAELQALVLKLPNESDRQAGHALTERLYDCWATATMDTAREIHSMYRVRS